MDMDADDKLDTAWIRPYIVSSAYTPTYGVVYVDASTLTTNTAQINCKQWGTDESRYRGTALQRRNNDDKQIVIVRECSEKLPSLCCASVPIN